MQLPSHGQWWSKSWTQLSQTEQCELLESIEALVNYVSEPWWAIEFTCTAPLHLDGNVVDVDIFVQRHEIIFNHVFRRYSNNMVGDAALLKA